MSFFSGILDDLREKRLWPVALALLAGLVAVPVLLSKHSSATPVAAVPTSLPSVGGPAAGLPTVSLDTTVAHSRLSGRSRDPFSQQVVPAGQAGVSPTTSTTPPTSGGTSTTPSGGTSTTPSGGKTGAGGTSTTGTTTTPTSTTTTPTVPTTPPQPAIPVLGANESYRVTLAMTDPFGGLQTIDPLQRLSVLPSNSDPLLVELGVLKGGGRVLFALEPGTVVSGPGTCTPGPIDCEVVSMAPGQVETLSTRSATGVNQVALFAVTAISRDKHPSAAAARKARSKVSAAGQKLLRSTTLPALSLFPYRQGQGVVVNLSNIKVGVL